MKKQLLTMMMVLATVAGAYAQPITGESLQITPLTGLIKLNGEAPATAIPDGTTGQALTTNGAGVYSFSTVTGATPGGSDTQLQYRVNSTTFGGISGATSSGTNVVFGDGNARLTSPWVTTSVDDSNGNIVLGITATGSAVNYFQVANGATGTGPTFTATGSDTNINLNFAPKGTGFLRTSGASSSDGTAPVVFRVQDNGTGSSGSWTTGAIQNAIDFFQSDGSGVGPSVRTRIASYTDNTVGNANGLQFWYSPPGAAMVKGVELDPTQGDFDVVTGNLMLAGTTRISNAGAGTFTTVDTGQGANELYAMNQDVETTDAVTFSTLNLTGGKITFPATQAASAGANVLDDYEEGTFTPAYASSSGSFGSITYGSASGEYIKVGRKVTVTVIITTTSVTVGTASGYIYITGMPSGIRTSKVMVGSVSNTSGWTTAKPSSCWVNPGQDRIYIMYDNSTQDTEVPVSHLTTGSTTTNYVTITYFTVN